MSRTSTYACDDCVAKLSPFIGEQWAASFLTVGPNMPSIHGCSKEHLGFALAKAFGIPIDGNLAAKLEAVSAHRDSLANDADQRLTQLQQARATIEAYEQAVREGQRPPSTQDLTGPKKPTKPVKRDRGSISEDDE